MTTKIVLNASAVTKLLEGMPEVEIEIAKNAAAQVAQVFLNRNVKFDLQNRLNFMMDELLLLPRLPSSEARKQVKALLDVMATEAINGKAGKLVADAISIAIKTIVPQVEQRMKTELTARIDSIIRERFEAVLGRR